MCDRERKKKRGRMREREIDGSNEREVTAAVRFTWQCVIRYFGYAQIIRLQDHK